MNYYPHHIGDYAKDTAHLTLIEDGAYRRLLDIYYASERPLPLNRDGLYRLARARSKEEKRAVDTVLEEFFSLGDSGWHNRRADSEIAKAQEKGMKARRSAEMRWHCERNANASKDAMRTHSEGNAPNNQEPITKKEQGAPADAGPVWGESVSLLTEAGVSEKSARSFLGLMCRDYDEPAVVEAVKAAVGKVNPTAYIRGVLKSSPKKGESAIKVDV